MTFHDHDRPLSAACQDGTIARRQSELPRPLRVATDGEVDLARKRPHRGNRLRPWIRKQRTELALSATWISRLDLGLSVRGEIRPPLTQALADPRSHSMAATH